MNALEANLLDRSMDRFGDTLLQNRLMKQRQEDQALQNAMRQEQIGLQRDELTARKDDMADAKKNRGLALASQEAHQQRLQAIQSEGNETKRNQMYLEFLGELNKTGQLTDEGLATMEEKFNEQFGQTGLGVKLFRRAEPPKRDGFETRDSHNIKQAEALRERAQAALRNGGGDESERLNRLAEQLERGVGRPLEDDRVTITEGIGESDLPGGDPPVKVTRKVAPDELEKMRKTLTAPKAVAGGASSAAKGASDQKFESVGQAREAGRKTGDIILLWDGTQQKYRRFQLD